MSNTHNEGPWTLTHISGSNFAVQEFKIRGMFGDTPDVYPIFNKDASAIDGTTIFCSPEDAKLIAAAPELLALLQELIDIEGPQPGHITWANKVKAAIAKATE